MAFAGVGFCQVDTMRLLEVGSVTAPGPITNWYFEDLNGDSIKEIILTTANSVNIYSGQSFAPIWSQEGFTNPQDLNFADINNDGLIDFSVKDTSHIYLIDPHHSTTIWTSPMLESTYKCYTIGDRNNDGYFDLFMAKQYSNIYYTDTIFITIFNGPQYSNYDTYVFSNGYVEYGCVEYIKRLYFMLMTNNGIDRYYLYVVSDKTCDEPAPHGHYYYYTGRIYLIDPIALDTIYSLTCGQTTDLIGTQIQDSNYCITMNRTYASYGYARRSSIRISPISNHTDIIYNGSNDLIGFVYGELNSLNPGWEICFNFNSYYMFMLSLPEIDLIWDANFERPENFLNWSIKFAYTPRIELNNIAYIVCRESNTNSYMLYNGHNGYKRWFMPYCRYLLNGAVNIDTSQGDILYSVMADSLKLLILAPGVDINISQITPSIFFLSSNYPNPFNASTMIEYGLPESGPVKVEIFDILGRKIQTLVDQTQSAGYHQVIWNGEGMPSGTYFYRIQAGEKTQTRKCLLLK
jgi:hypothetical protein